MHKLDKYQLILIAMLIIFALQSSFEPRHVVSWVFCPYLACRSPVESYHPTCTGKAHETLQGLNFGLFLNLGSENWEDRSPRWAFCSTHGCSTWPGPAGTGRCWRGRCSIHLYPGSGSCSASPRPLRPERYLWPTARRILRGQQRGTNIDFVSIHSQLEVADVVAIHKTLKRTWNWTLKYKLVFSWFRVCIVCGLSIC